MFAMSHTVVKDEVSQRQLHDIAVLVSEHLIDPIADIVASFCRYPLSSKHTHRHLSGACNLYARIGTDGGMAYVLHGHSHDVHIHSPGRSDDICIGFPTAVCNIHVNPFVCDELIIITSDGLISICSIQSGERITIIETGEQMRGYCSVCSLPDGTIAVAPDDGGMSPPHIWSFRNHDITSSVTLPARCVRLRISSAGHLLLDAEWRGGIRTLPDGDIRWLIGYHIVEMTKDRWAAVHIDTGCMYRLNWEDLTVCFDEVIIDRIQSISEDVRAFLDDDDDNYESQSYWRCEIFHVIELPGRDILYFNSRQMQVWRDGTCLMQERHDSRGFRDVYLGTDNRHISLVGADGNRHVWDFLSRFQ